MFIYIRNYFISDLVFVEGLCFLFWLCVSGCGLCLPVEVVAWRGALRCWREFFLSFDVTFDL